MKAIYLNNNEPTVRRVYAERQRERLSALTQIDQNRVYGAEDLRDGGLEDVEAAFSTWGMPRLSVEEIEKYLPNLREVYYAAGSVQDFARPFLEHGVRVFSAWQANAVPVVRYTVAQVLLAVKGYFRVQPACRYSRQAAHELFDNYPGSYEIRVGLLGCGAIGRRVAQLLVGMDMEVLVFDPFLSEEQAAALGVRKADMAEIFATCQVVSNHLANLPATVGIIKREHLLSMLPYSTFINTGRGPQLDERDLFDMLVQDSTRTALLDVMTEEGKSVANPLNQLENCLITPHIAGSSGREVRRMADYMLDTFERVRAGQPSDYEVTMKMLESMA